MRETRPQSASLEYFYLHLLFHRPRLGDLLQKLLNSLTSLNDVSDRLLDLQELFKGEIGDHLPVAVDFEVVRVAGDDFDEEEVGGAGWWREGGKGQPREMRGEWEGGQKRTSAEVRNTVAAEEEGGLVREVTVWAGGATLVVSEATVDEGVGQLARTWR